LIDLLKKNNFGWNSIAEESVSNLERAITQALILALLDFSKPFILETDACDLGVGVVLVQEGKLLAFLSQALAPKHLGLSIYDKELLAVIIAIEKWRYYLEGNQFIIKDRP